MAVPPRNQRRLNTYSKFDLHKDNYLLLIIHSSLLFHVKHFLEKTLFLPGKASEFSVKNPKYYWGQPHKKYMRFSKTEPRL
jgi:hypothetical protein